jgi:hypothetical protein
MQSPPTHSQPHRFGRFVAYRRIETKEQCARAIHRAPGPEAFGGRLSINFCLARDLMCMMQSS